jgi:legumain
MASINGHVKFLLLVLLSIAVGCQSRDITESFKSKVKRNAKTNSTGTQWAVLVAGSQGFNNYRHQADICHSYQILKKGGLKDENIIIFMYDDIAHNDANPRPGVIINEPNGSDVYNGIPKDYIGEHCNVENFYAVLLGNKSAVTGGSGKVLSSGPDDHIFIYYTDHGAPGIVTMPVGDDVYAKDLITVLKKKSKAKTYKSLVFYLEACESGSMFDGLLTKDMNIYAVTASNPTENSFGTYCPGDDIGPPAEYDTCLGDLFSVSWMEDSDVRDMSKETLNEQYKTVKTRTGTDKNGHSSHVMQYGNLEIAKEFASNYIGINPANKGHSYIQSISSSSSSISTNSRPVSQYDSDLVYLQTKYDKAPKDSHQKIEAQKKLDEEINQRKTLDNNMNQITTILFGDQNGHQVLTSVRSPGQPLVDDWNCLKTLVKTYEEQCRALSIYGKKYTRAIANMCNAGINVEQMKMASIRACST